MKHNYVAESVEDFLKSSEAGEEVRYVGDAGRDPCLNQRTITSPYVDIVTVVWRCNHLRQLGITAGEIPWKMGTGAPDWRALIQWRLPRKR